MSMPVPRSTPELPPGVPEPLWLSGENLAFTAAAPTVPPRLTAHAHTMAQGIYRVASDFYVAVGYGCANMTLVVGSDGVLIVDCLETEAAARHALGDLRRVSGCDTPVRGVIYSHSHPDHISGVRAVLAADPATGAPGEVEIYAHARLPAVILGNLSLGNVPATRLAYTFGLGLESGPEGRVEAGLGPLLHVGAIGFVPPTTLFEGSLDISVAGIRVQLREAPSESDDEIVLWFPDHGVLHVADVVQGECLPNVYPLRGAVRDPLQWLRALDMLRTYDARALIFGHGRPCTEPAAVRDLLVAYRDAVQYTHDQAVRLMARGLTPDEIVEAIGELPPRLRDHPWLGEFYGTVKQTVRQIYHNAYGWYEGDPTFIDPLPRRERAARYVAAMGGRDAVVAAANRSMADGDARWTAEVLTHLLRLDPDDQAARPLKAAALRQLGFAATNPIWRNNYLMAAHEIDGTLDRPGLGAALRALRNPDVTGALPIPLVLRALATRLNPARGAGVRLHVGLHATDTGASAGLAIREDVAVVLPVVPPDATLGLRAAEATLRDLLTGRLPWSRAVADGAVTLDAGSTDIAERFWGLFDSPATDPPALALR